MEGRYWGLHSAFQAKELTLYIPSVNDGDINIFHSTHRLPIPPKPLTRPMLAARLLGGLGTLLLTHTKATEEPA